MTLSENWGTLWESLAASRPDHVAVVLGDTRITWRALDDRAARLAGALAAHGVGHDTKVAQLLYNSPEYLESVYAAFKLRACPVNVNYRYLAPEIVHVLGDSGTEVLVFHGTFADRVAEAAEALPNLRLLVQVDDGTPLLPGAIRYEDLIASSEPMAPIERSGEDVLILYTGGTTGLPKGVVWGHVDLWKAMAYPGYITMGIPIPETVDEVSRVAAELHAAGRSPINLCAPPLMHGTALFLALGTFVLGGTVVLLANRRYDADELLRLVERERVSQMSIVGDAFGKPIVAALERAEVEGRPYDLSSLGRIMTTGATMSAEVKRGIMSRATNTAIIDMIGASEGGPFATAVTPPGGDPGATAVFTISPNAVVLDDETWEPIPHGSGRAGVLACAGTIPRAYFKDPEKSARTFRTIDGVLHSVPGDYAIVDADGTVHLLGRGSVCINTGGEKVYPEEVEVAARSFPGVADCNAVGVPDDRFGEAVTLVVALQPGASVDHAALIAHIKTRIAAYKAPKHVVEVPELYRSPSGKADYRWARTQAIDALATRGS
jgi:acyl-CoA synthetase (AMP-forming)/AMP-acid ligase II